MNKAQTVVLNTEVKGSFVLLYQLKPRRGVPLEESHMFPASLWIHRWRWLSQETKSLFACVLFFFWGKDSQILRETAQECVAEVHHSCSGYPSRHRAGSPKAEQSVSQCATAEAICTVSWPSLWEQECVLSNPIWDVAYLCQPFMPAFCVLD